MLWGKSSFYMPAIASGCWGIQVTALLNLKSKGRPQHQSDAISLSLFLSQLHCTPSFTSDGFKSSMLA